MYIRGFIGSQLRLSIVPRTLLVCCFIAGSAVASADVRFFEQQIFVKDTAVKNVVLGAPGGKDTAVSWYFVRPLALDYDNTKNCHTPGYCVTPIRYGEMKIPIDPADQLAPANTGLIHGPGTYLFIRRDGSSETRYRLAVRRSDDYVGYLTELLGVPFVYAPSYIKGKGHQTDAGLGADCVAVVIYGMRRAGRKIRYVGPPALYNLMHKIGDSTRLNKIGIRAGDVLHFGFQTAVITQDVPPLGVLNDNDRIIESYHRYVEEVRFSDLPYRNMPFDILRWDASFQ